MNEVIYSFFYQDFSMNNIGLSFKYDLDDNIWMTVKEGSLYINFDNYKEFGSISNIIRIGGQKAIGKRVLKCLLDNGDDIEKFIIEIIMKRNR